jgi:hypothetical protein
MLWVAIGSLLVGLIIGVASTRIASRGSREPRRSITYGISVTPLLSADHGVADVEIRRAGVLLHKPHIARVLIGVRGNVDIQRQHFDNAQPLKIRLGARVIDILDIDSSPEGIQTPDVVTYNDSIHIGPGLLSKNHKLEVVALVDGEATIDLESPISGTIPRRLEDVERQYQPVLDIAAELSSGSLNSYLAVALVRAAMNLIRRRM